ncbi:AMP-binding protein [Saccharolobus islandicus]|uniref:Acyl-coenzyme A synthetase/AMP-(Fatty) acid ligase n=1 Tax=Saccharolobus islandicus LAL14/1 TaxID=1241935 RepID=M9UDU8_SACIS|nr:AMP-binding protein [Sulfolobus islandicus]AGJ62360.1 Acyl-coenzyme A synthetase/AMP-(fatty) acid ligase [Sulfolobus islandicus LAL14/1]
MLEVDLREIRFHSYDELVRTFKWNIPSHFNIGESILDRKIKEGLGDNIAIYYEDEEGNHFAYTFTQLKNLSDSLITILREIGVKRGDVVGIYLQPRVETVISILSLYRLGAISLSISPLMGAESVEYRIRQSDAKAIIIEGSRREVRQKLRNITKIIVADSARDESEIDFDEVKRTSGVYYAVDTKSDEPAQLFYTSGSTGAPKGVLHAHRFLLGHIPAYQLYFEMAPKEEDVFYTPADWGWIGAIGDVLLPSLYFGKPIVAYRRLGKFSPKDALAIMQKYKVTCAFIPPTALRMIRREVINPRRDYDLRSRAISSAGEAVGEDLLEWAIKKLSPNVNEFYGCTEANLVTVNNSMWRKIGSIGKATPGHEIAVIDEKGNKVINQVGEIAVRMEDPVLFLGYYKNPEATAKKFRGYWFLMGDLGLMDQNGYIWFKGRGDDVIKVSGYRLGPEEIESVILQHSAVQEVAVIGKPDKLRGNIIKAFIVLKDEYSPSDNLIQEIQEFVKNRLALYAYPREIEFVKELPRTETGKLKRFELRKKEEEKS